MQYRLVFICMMMLEVIIAFGCGSGNSGLTTGGPSANTWYADSVAGNDSNNCKSSQSACRTIGHAISLTESGDSIMVAAATYAENPYIFSSLTIVGSGAGTTIIDGGGLYTAVTIGNSSTTVTLSGLTIQNGFGGGQSGGGVENKGTLTINNSMITGNRAGLAGLDGSAFGGGIYNSGTLVINNSAIIGNAANELRSCERACSGSGQGGGIFSTGSLTINNSTLSENSASAYSQPSSGGAIAGSGSVSINNSTISGNRADSAGGIDAGATIQNSIFAGNSGENCSGTMTSNGYNLSDDGTCNFSGPGDVSNTNPLLGPLQNNGGPTQTQALLPGSPAIDAGNPHGCTDGQGHLLKTDQRGQLRPDPEDSGGCDIGAYEQQSD